MKPHQEQRAGLTCLALVIAIVMLAITGCTESDQEQQVQPTVTNEKQIEKPVATAIVTTRTTAAPVQPSTAQPPGPAFPGAVVTIDPIGDRNIGDKFTITGTSSLPAGTNLFWEIRPDTGTPPTGIQMTTQMGILANNQVTKGSGTANRVALDVEMKDMSPAKYVVVVVSIDGDPMTVNPSTGTLAGYTYFTLK
jgi:hypothetical protein